MLAFQSRLPLPMWLLLPAQLAAVIFALLELAQTKHDKWVLTSGAGVAAFFLAALVAHRTLYLHRPRARYLTEFYLWMSFGGVLGGLFSALIAPRIFSEVFEYPLLIALSLACRPGVFDQPGSVKTDVIWILGIFAAGLLVIWQGPLLAAQYGYTFGDWGTTPVIALGVRRRGRRLLEPRRPPADGGADDVRRRHHAALRRQARRRRSAATTASTASASRRAATSMS